MGGGTRPLKGTKIVHNPCDGKLEAFVGHSVGDWQRAQVGYSTFEYLGQRETWGTTIAASKQNPQYMQIDGEAFKFESNHDYHIRRAATLIMVVGPVDDRVTPKTKYGNFGRVSQ